MIQVDKESSSHDFIWKAYRECNDLRAQESLVRCYLPLVEQMANRLSKNIPQNLIAKEDLIGMGYIGLIEAIKKFDYKKGYQFETYGLWRIKGAMLDGLRQSDWVPRGSREKARRLKDASRILEQQLMRTPTEDELSHFTELPLEDIRQGLSVLTLSTLLSLNEPISANEESGNKQSRLEQVEDKQTMPQEQEVQMDEFKEMLAACINQLPEKEKLVLTLLYYEELSQVEIAEVLNLTKGRISQIHSQAILRIRKYFEARNYRLDTFF